MNTIFRLHLFFAMVLMALGADVKFSALPTATSPSTNSFVPIIDLNLPAANQNEKYLLTNLATVAYANTNVPRFSFASKLVATDASSNAVAQVNVTITNDAINATSMFFDQGTTNAYVIRKLQNSVTDGAGSYTNSIFQIGMDPLLQYTNAPQWMQFESNWRNSGTNLMAEWHYDVGLGSGSLVRPFGFGVFRTGSVTWLLGGVGSFFDSSCVTQQIRKAETGKLEFFNGDREISFSKNNAQVLSMLNAAGDTYLPLPYYNAENMLYLPVGTILPIGAEMFVTNGNIKISDGQSYRYKSGGVDYNALLCSGTTVVLDAKNYITINKPTTFSGSVKYPYASGGNVNLANHVFFAVTNNAQYANLPTALNGGGQVYFVGTTGSASYGEVRANFNTENIDGNLKDYVSNGQFKMYVSDGTAWHSFDGSAGTTKVCTSGTTNALFWVSVANTNSIGGKVVYVVSATDGTDTQEITGTCQFGAVGKSTTVTGNVTDVQNTSTVSAGTLTAAITRNVSTNNVFALMVNPTTSLTTTNLTVKWKIETPQVYPVNAL